MLFYTERYLDTISNSPTPCSDTFNKHGLTKLLDCWLTRNTGRAKNLLWWSLLLAFTSSLLFPLNVCMCLTAIISNVKPMKSGLLSNPTPYCTLVTYLCSKNGVWTMCFRPPQEKKKQKKTNTEIPCLATLKREIPVKRVQNLWTSEVFVHTTGLVKKKLFHCFVQNTESDWTLISAWCVTLITSLYSVLEEAKTAYGKNH